MTADSETLTTIDLDLSLRIRMATRDDLEALEWWGQYAEHREIIRAAFDRQRMGEVEMLVADLDGFPVAQVWIDFRQAPGAEQTASLWAVRVLAPLQNMGIGARMMLAAEDRIRERGRREAMLTVERSNNAARRFYERLGYGTTGHEGGSYCYRAPDGAQRNIRLDQWIMRKTLAAPSRRPESHARALP